MRRLVKYRKVGNQGGVTVKLIQLRLVAAAAAVAVSSPSWSDDAAGAAGGGQNQHPASAPAQGDRQPGQSGGNKKDPALKAIADAYRESVRKVFPLSNEQVRDFKQQIDNTEQEIRGNPPTGMRAATRQVSLRAGSDIQRVALYPGYTTAIVVQDSDGEPWPITGVVVGDSALYDVAPINPAARHMVIVSPLTRFGSASVTVALEGHPMPLMVQLVTTVGDKRRPDSTLVFHLDQRGPNARPVVMGPPPTPVVNGEMLGFVDGVPPNGARPLVILPKMEGLWGWEYQGEFVIRTTHAMVWPSWNQIINGQGGIRVYRIPKSNGILLDRDGQNVNVQVE